MVSAPFISAETQMQETLQKQSGGVSEQLPEGKSYSQVDGKPVRKNCNVES